MLLLEISKSTSKVLSAAWTNGDFIELPDSSYSIHVADVTLAQSIWESHINGGTITVNENGTFTIGEVTPPPTEPVKTPEQVRIEQLERDNEQLMIAVADLYEQVLLLQGGS